MRNFIMPLIAAALAVMLWPEPAHSQQFCGADGKAIKDALEKKYGEVMVGMGNTRPGHLTLLYLSKKTQTWSILDVDPNGPTCIIASGYNWETVAEKILGEPS